MNGTAGATIKAANFIITVNSWLSGTLLCQNPNLEDQISIDRE